MMWHGYTKLLCCNVNGPKQRLGLPDPNLKITWSSWVLADQGSVSLYTMSHRASHFPCNENTAGKKLSTSIP